MELQGKSDGELILLIRQGRREFFRQIVERYWKRVHSLIRRMVQSPELVKDLCQETFLHAINKIDQFDVSRNFGSWIFKIAVNVVYRNFNNSEKLKTSPLEENYINSDVSSPSAKVLNRMAIDGYLEGLPLGLRILFILRHGLMLSYDEIAELLGEPLGSVKGNLYRAREKLRTLRSLQKLSEENSGKPGKK